MDGLMMDYPLTIPKILQRAARVFPDKELVSLIGNKKHRHTYAEMYGRVVKLMNVLRKLGVKRGDRVATFGWNHFRHMELYYAIPALGAVLHTLNLRLFPEQLRYIVNHAEDSVIFLDDSLLKPMEGLAPDLKSVREYVVMSDNGGLPESTLEPLHDYEELMAAASDQEDFPDFGESEACGLCYTSGTTGNPKGSLYSHRAIFLHSMMFAMTELAFKERDVVLPVVPMFHANCWSTPYSCPMVGSTLVFAGSNVQPENIVRLIEEESVTIALGVPTIWAGMLQYLEQSGKRLDTVQRMLVGGSAVPRKMIVDFKQKYDVRILQGWGMTEMSPLGSLTSFTGKMEDWPEEKQFDVMAKCGVPATLVEMKITDDEGRELPWDGKATGELLVKGPCVISAYYHSDEGATAFTEDGWFHTGDVASIDENSVLRISDRTKDLIKSGGEWISSVDMENAIMACPGVAESAVVARPDPKWDERPVAFVVRAKDGAELTGERIVAHLGENFAKWQLPTPEDVRFVEEIPKTSVGKFDKKVLRERLPA